MMFFILQRWFTQNALMKVNGFILVRYNKSLNYIVWKLGMTNLAQVNVEPFHQSGNKQMSTK
jgi:hypothetical protein